jgi:hypothetical protein
VDGFTPFDLQQKKIQKKHPTVFRQYRLQNNRYSIDIFFGDRLCANAFFFWSRIDLMV